VKQFLKKPFYLGDLALPNNVLYAPLAGCSDLPFRKMSSLYQPGIVYCEMVKIDALVRHNEGTFRLLDYEKDSNQITGAQLCGSKLELIGQAAKMIEDLGFQVIDFNCGCPVDKVTKDGSGSGMLKTPELIGEMIAEMVASVKIPVTVKIRAGWDEDQINAPLITQIAEKAGAKAIAVHGRTREQGYKGPANWDYIRDAKKAAKTILVIGNGDVFDAESAERMFIYTGCDAVLVSRGTLGQPWIAEDIRNHLEDQVPTERDVETVRNAMLTHFDAILKYQKDERKALLDFRRVGCWYLKRCIGGKALRMELVHLASTKEVLNVVEQFPWESLQLNPDTICVG
jgi:nifR3 family TIM-barrel protein